MGQPLYNLQALRGTVCLGVIVYHIWHWGWTWFGARAPGIDLVRWVGNGTVDVFFVLSGFLIPYRQAGRVGRPAEAPRFLVRRLWRIYPTYWVVLAAAAATFAVFPGVSPANFSLADWVAYVALLPVPYPGYPYVGPAYTLSYELAFYLAFAAVVALPWRGGVGLLFGWAAVVVAALPAYPVSNLYVRVVLSPFVLEFVAGYLACELIRRGLTRGGWAAVAGGLGYGFAALAVSGAALGPQWLASLGWQPWRVAIYGPPAALLVYGLAAVEVRGRRLPSPGWLRAAGDASYSLYLVHGPLSVFALWFGFQLPHSRLPHLAWIGVTFAVCVGCGFLLHYAVERPILGLGRRRKPTRPTPTPAGDEPAPSPGCKAA